MEPRVAEVHVTKAKSVEEYAYFEDKNFPTRKTMEDNYIAVDDFCGDGSGLFGILDGHGGSEVSEFCANALPNVQIFSVSQLFEQQYLKSKTDIKGAFERTMLKADEQLKLVGASQTGTTCCLVFIKNNEGVKNIHVANLGDTRAVISIDGLAKRITNDHKTSNQQEQERVKKQGGLILKGRVAGQLAITRALGDLGLKQQGVSNIPQVESFPLEHNTKLLIIASDGLWDICEDQQAVDLVKGLGTTKEMSKSLVQFALKNGSKDNISVVVLKLK